MAETEKNRLIHVKIVTPFGSVNNISENEEFDCDSVRMTAQDNAKNCGGGNFGVRYGHTAALAALDKGDVAAFLNGKLVKKFEVNGGFAKITKDSVTIITDEYKSKP